MKHIHRSTWFAYSQYRFAVVCLPLHIDVLFSPTPSTRQSGVLVLGVLCCQLLCSQNWNSVIHGENAG